MSGIALTERILTIMKDAEAMRFRVPMLYDLDGIRGGLDARLRELNLDMKAGRRSKEEYATLSRMQVDEFERNIRRRVPRGRRRPEEDEISAYGKDIAERMTLMYDPSTSPDAAQWLRAAGPRALPALAELLRIGNCFARAAALWAINHTRGHDSNVIDAVLEATRDQYAQVREYALLILYFEDSKGRNAEFLSAFLGAIGDYSADARGSAIAGVGRASLHPTVDSLQRGLAAVAPALRDKDEEVRAIAQSTSEFLADSIVRRSALSAYVPSLDGKVTEFFSEDFVVKASAAMAQEILKEVAKGVAVEIVTELIRHEIERVQSDLRKAALVIEAANAVIRERREEAERHRQIEREMREHFERDIEKTADGRTDLERPAIERDHEKYA